MKDCIRCNILDYLEEQIKPIDELFCEKRTQIDDNDAYRHLDRSNLHTLLYTAATVKQLKQMPPIERGEYLWAEVRIHFEVIDCHILIPTYEPFFSYKIYDPKSITNTILLMNDVLNLRSPSISCS